MKSALLVLNVQRGLFAMTPRPSDAEAVLERINYLTARARQSGTPVAFIQHERPSGFLEYLSESWELAQELILEPTDTRIRKATPDAFLHTHLSAWLTAHGVQQIILCGYPTEFCIDTTARSAAGLGYDVLLVSDAHTTHDKGHATAAQIQTHHNITLPNLISFGARIRAIASAKVEWSPPR